MIFISQDRNEISIRLEELQVTPELFLSTDTREAHASYLNFELPNPIQLWICGALASSIPDRA